MTTDGTSKCVTSAKFVSCMNLAHPAALPGEKECKPNNVVGPNLLLPIGNSEPRQLSGRNPARGTPGEQTAARVGILFGQE